MNINIPKKTMTLYVSDVELNQRLEPKLARGENAYTSRNRQREV